jgi:hypothetical protein
MLCRNNDKPLALTTPVKYCHTEKGKLLYSVRQIPFYLPLDRYQYRCHFLCDVLLNMAAALEQRH